MYHLSENKGFDNLISYLKQTCQKFRAAVSVAVATAIVVFSLFVCNGSAAAADAADASVGTHDELRLAILAAPTDGTRYTIEVAADIAMTGTLAVAVGKNIVLRSNEGDTWTLTRNSSGNSRHFTVAATLTLENIILDGASASGGVSVNTASSVFYLNAGAVIQNCKTSTAAEGGGLTISGGGTATVSGGKIVNNQKPGTNGGGGIYMNGGTVTIEDGEISGNKAGDESFTSSSYNGGGISAFNSTITVIDGKINGNEAAQHGGGVSLGANSTFTMTGGEIIGNAISARSDSSGGGIYGIGSTEINISDVTIQDNTSKRGGGIYALGKLDISESTISGNTATSGNGGGIYATGATTMDNCIIAGNTAGGGTSCGNGGGLYYSNAVTELAISNGVFSGNKAETTATSSGSGTGGAICASGTIKLSGNVRIGGDTAEEGNAAKQYGGGIFISGGSTLTVSDTVKISQNTANDGGGILCNGGSTSPVSISIGDSVEISNNHAARRGGGIMSNDGTGTGVVAHVITIAGDATVGDNTAGTLGGGVFIYRGGSINVTGGEISGNAAGTAGGGIYGATATSITVSGGEITGNSAAVTYLPPDGATVLYPKILFAEVSATTHLLNNDDINYKGEIALKYSVTYHANGGSGSFHGKEIVQGGTDIVLPLADAGIMHDGHVFKGWNTKADGMGTAYAPSNTIVLLGNIDLYAQWESSVVPPVSYSDPDSDPDPDPYPTPDPLPEPEPTPDPEPAPASEFEPELEPESEPESEPKPYIPGGTDPDVLPVTNDPGSTLILTAERRYIELGEGDIPLGEWYWDAVPEMWLFDEYPPLGGLPQTGHEGASITRLLSLLGFSLLGTGLRLRSGGIFYKPKRMKK